MSALSMGSIVLMLIAKRILQNMRVCDKSYKRSELTMVDARHDLVT